MEVLSRVRSWRSRRRTSLSRRGWKYEEIIIRSGKTYDE
jgi:hypothetical protein